MEEMSAEEKEPHQHRSDQGSQVDQVEGLVLKKQIAQNGQLEGVWVEALVQIDQLVHAIEGNEEVGVEEEGEAALVEFEMVGKTDKEKKYFA